MMLAGWVVALAMLLLLLGLELILGGRDMLRRRGLGEGRTVALDDVTLIIGRSVPFRPVP